MGQCRRTSEKRRVAKDHSGRKAVAGVLTAFLLACCAQALAQAPAPAPVQAPVAPRFDIQRFIVEGNSLLTQAEIDRIVAPFTGKSRDFGDVQRALEALQDTYLARGFIAVRVNVPEQDLVSGQVRLEVVEARIGRVRVENNKFFSEANVRASMPTLAVGEPPNTRRISQGAQLVNENPAKQVTSGLEASDEERKIDAVIRVTDSNPKKFTAFLDNTGNSPTGYYRAGLGFQHANVADRDHVLNAQLITSPTQTKDVAIVGLGYRIPVYSRQGAIDVMAGYSNVNSGTVQNLFNVSGAGSTYGLRYTQILPRIETYEQKLALGLDYRAFHNNVVLVGTTESLVPDLTVKPLTLTYTGRQSQVGRDISFYGSVSQNLPGGAHADQAAFTLQREGAIAGYTVWRIGAAYSQVLPRDFLLRAAFSAQQTKNLLVPAEQFGMGGMDSVRGFHERETANDVGHRVSFELYTPDFGARVGNDWRSRALVFVDAARGSDNEPARGTDNGLASAGIGVRMNHGKSLAMRFDLARVLNEAGTRPAGKEMVQFSVAYSF